MRGIGCLGIMLAVSACAVDASSNMTRDVANTVIGPAAQRDVALADSQISLGMPELPVRGRRGRALSDRYDETVSFDGGAVRYERLHITGFAGSNTNIGAIQNSVDSDLFRQHGLTKAVEKLTRVVNRYGVAQYTVLENAQWRCSAFAEYFWMGGTTWATSPGNAELRGNLCYPMSDQRAAKLEALTERLVNNIQVGPGVNQGAATQEAAAPLPSAAPPAAPGSASASSSSDFKVAPPGTRFVTVNGYIQIVRVDGYVVTTVNAANQTGRWLAGLLNPRIGTTIDDGPIASLFPIAVGKEVTLEETASRDRWRYTIKVLRTEPYSVGNRAYHTFVIEVRDQSLTPDQGGFDRRRTVWYSPELGGLVRQREVQAGGPPVRLFNWDVIDVVPPRT